MASLHTDASVDCTMTWKYVVVEEIRSNFPALFEKKNLDYI